MKPRLFPMFSALLLLLSLLAPSPARAAGGGSTLPFNDPMTLIKDNLTGPTADTVVVIIIVCGLIAMGVSTETPWLKTLGRLAVICALIAKAATLPSALGLGSATGAVEAYRGPAALLSIAWLTGAILVLLPLLHLPRRSAADRG
jgi:type IV secretory pathway VirB2 component (pilin)